MLIGLSGPRHHSASVSFIQNPISWVSQNLHCFLHPPFYASSNASNICSPSISLPRPEPFLPAIWSLFVSPCRKRGCYYISPLVGKGSLQYIAPLCREGWGTLLTEGEMGSRSSTAVDLSKVCAHNKLCSSVQSIDLPLRQGEREKTRLSLCHYVFTSLMILFFPPGFKGIFKIRKHVSPF